MLSFIKILPSKADRSRLSGWIFFIAWWVGAIALVAGLEVAEGLLENLVAMCVFAAACTIWWGAYRLSNFAKHSGFIVIGLWTFVLLGALLHFRDYATRPFFWVSAAMLLLLILVAVVSETRSTRVSEQ
jgi:hypothetical protein